MTHQYFIQLKFVQLSVSGSFPPFLTLEKQRRRIQLYCKAIKLSTHILSELKFVPLSVAPYFHDIHTKSPQVGLLGPSDYFGEIALLLDR